MEIWKEVVETFRKNLPETLSKFGGVSPLPGRKLTTRMSNSTFDEAIRDQYRDAVEHGIAAELLNKLLDDAQASAILHNHFTSMKPDDMTGFAVSIINAAELLGDDSIIIMSPTHLTLTQSAGLFERNETEEASPPLGMFDFVGTLGGFPVCINSYASDLAPTLICGSGWFTYESGDVLRATQTTDLNTDETEINFISDTRLFPVEGKISSVSVDPNGIQFW